MAERLTPPASADSGAVTDRTEPDMSRGPVRSPVPLVRPPTTPPCSPSVTGSAGRTSSGPAAWASCRPGSKTLRCRSDSLRRRVNLIKTNRPPGAIGPPEVAQRPMRRPWWAFWRPQEAV